MAESVDELTYDYEDEGVQTRKQIAKSVLTKGAWSTIMFLFQELDRKNDEWKPPKCAIVRYRKMNGQYRKQSSFNISSEKQARQIIGVMEEWFAENGPAKADAPSQ